MTHMTSMTHLTFMNRIVAVEVCDATVDDRRLKVDNIKTINGRNSNTAINGRSQRI